MLLSYTFESPTSDLTKCQAKVVAYGGGHLQEGRPQGGLLTRSLGLLNHFLLEPWLSFLCPKYISEIVAMCK